MLARFFLLTCALLVLALVPIQPPRAEACAAVWSKSDPPVAIAEESAVIVWDAAQKVQHFIRWAAFEAKSASFGFLVPTPTQPKLAEVSEGVFSTLETWTAPKVVTPTEWNFQPMLCMFGCMKMSARLGSPNAAVRVLHRQTVGGLDAAVLEADDAEALRQWLDKNGYSARPELTSWLAPYLAERWKITAFKIAHDPKTGQAVKTSPVRMSFRTEKPFFPYREPEEPKESAAPPYGPRLLRVFFVGEARVQASVGGAGWSARVPWSNPLEESQRAALAKTLDLKDEQLPTEARLTVFEDRSSPRAGQEEVYFAPAADQSNVVPPDRVIRNTIWIPGDLIVIGVGVVGLVALGMRKKRLRRLT